MILIYSRPFLWWKRKEKNSFELHKAITNETFRVTSFALKPLKQFSTAGESLKSRKGKSCVHRCPKFDNRAWTPSWSSVPTEFNSSLSGPLYRATRLWNCIIVPLLYALLQRIQLRPPKVESQQAVYRMFYSCNLDFRGLRFHIHTFTRCVARSIRPTRRNFPREFAFV